MRILHLSWEYPPLVYGGLGRHVHALAESQAQLGHEVVVVTQHAEGGAPDSWVNGVRVVRVPPDPPVVPFDQDHLIAWVASLNSALTRGVIDLNRDWHPQAIHGHDWMVAHTALAVRDLVRVPCVTTMHATEAGRHQGWLPTELSQTIHGVEWWLTNQASRVIVCSEYMRWEVEQLFDLPSMKTVVIPNGVDVSRWNSEWHPSGPVPVIVYLGRLEWEKGVHTLIDAVARLRSVRLLIAGRGSKEADLRAQVRRHRLTDRVTFTGWMPDEELAQVVASAAAVVVPSLYEPFGMVALEAAAAAAPVVVARTGGLQEVITDRVTGRTFPPGDDAALAAVLADVLEDLDGSRALGQRAQVQASRAFQWSHIASRTVEVYREASRARPPRAAVRQPTPRSGNLLRVDRGA